MCGPWCESSYTRVLATCGPVTLKKQIISKNTVEGQAWDNRCRYSSSTRQKMGGPKESLVPSNFEIQQGVATVSRPENNPL